MSNSCIIFCQCNAGVIPDRKSDQLKNAFQHLETDVFELQDLCAISVNEKSVFVEISEKYKQKVIVACYPRAVKNMILQAGINSEGFDVLSFKELSIDEINTKLKVNFGFKEGNANYQQKVSELKVPAWYPVIDTSRCSLCGQCARFCLFGVYSYNKKSLEVVNPLSCKNNCPACGRTCPESAIMFPRLKENSVLAGAEPDEKANQAPGKKDSLFVMLNERNKGRKNIFKQGVVQLAEEERKRALKEFKESIRKEK